MVRRGADRIEMQMASPWGHTVVKAWQRRYGALGHFREGLVVHPEPQNKHQNVSPFQVMVRWGAFVKASLEYEGVKREGNLARAMAFAASGEK